MGERILLTHRETATFIERSKVFVDDGRVLYQQAEGGTLKRFNVPYCNISVLFLGQGTSITNSAARLLSEEGVFVAFTGTGGSPLLFGSLTNYQVTKHIINMVNVYQSEDLSLQASKIIMNKRCENMSDLSAKIIKKNGRKLRGIKIEQPVKNFKTKIDMSKTTKSLLGYEGDFAKKVYASYAKQVNLTDFKRNTGAKDYSSNVGRVNSMIDHGNYIAYGIAGAVLWTLGIPASFSVLHGKTRAGGLVFDLADSFKDSVVLPLSFCDFDNEESFRDELISFIHDESIMESTFKLMERILNLGDVK
jgi:CRISPR-associated protein Cas1